MDPVTMAMIGSSFMGGGGSNPLGAIGGGLGGGGGKTSSARSAAYGGDFFAGAFNTNFGGEQTTLYWIAGIAGIYALSILLNKKRK